MSFIPRAQNFLQNMPNYNTAQITDPNAQPGYSGAHGAQAFGAGVGANVASNIGGMGGMSNQVDLLKQQGQNDIQKQREFFAPGRHLDMSGNDMAATPSSSSQIQSGWGWGKPAAPAPASWDPTYTGHTTPNDAGGIRIPSPMDAQQLDPNGNGSIIPNNTGAELWRQGQLAGSSTFPQRPLPPQPRPQPQPPITPGGFGGFTGSQFSFGA